MIEQLKTLFQRKDSSVQADDDWIEDFSGNLKSDLQLEQRAAQLAGPGNKELRQLIKEALCMRWSARILLERVRSQGGLTRESDEDSALKIAAWLVDLRTPTK